VIARAEKNAEATARMMNGFSYQIWSPNITMIAAWLKARVMITGFNSDELKL